MVHRQKQQQLLGEREDWDHKMPVGWDRINFQSNMLFTPRPTRSPQDSHWQGLDAMQLSYLCSTEAGIQRLTASEEPFPSLLKAKFPTYLAVDPEFESSIANCASQTAAVLHVHRFPSSSPSSTICFELTYSNYPSVKRCLHLMYTCQRWSIPSLISCMTRKGFPACCRG